VQNPTAVGDTLLGTAEKIPIDFPTEWYRHRRLMTLGDSIKVPTDRIEHYDVRRTQVVRTVLLATLLGSVVAAIAVGDRVSPPSSFIRSPGAESVGGAKRSAGSARPRGRPGNHQR
jgi:hypothetical protein